MPKRSRQAHIPSQVRRRKPRREIGPVYAEPSASDAGVATSPARPVAPVEAQEARRRRRLESLMREREGSVVRSLPGQLPTFERSYMVNELKRIGIISGSLLAVLVVLTVLLR